MVVAVLGVLGASRRASRVRALDALRDTGRAAAVMTWPRWMWGSFCLAGGVALITVAPAVGGEAALALSLLVCVVLVIAFSALSPLVVPLVGWLLGGLPLRVAGPDFLVPVGLVPVGEGERRYVVRVDDGVDPPAIAERVRAADLGIVSTVSEFVRADVDLQQWNSLKVMVALLGLAALCTVIAMVNAVVIAADRTTEFAVARLTGLARRQVVLAALWESLAVAVVGLLLGGLAAAGTVTGVSVAVSDIVGTAVIGVPWLLFGVLAAGATTIVGVTSVLTTVAVTRRPAVIFAGARE